MAVMRYACALFPFLPHPTHSTCPDPSSPPNQQGQRTALDGFDGYDRLHRPRCSQQVTNHALGAIDAQLVPWQGTANRSVLGQVASGCAGGVCVDVGYPFWCNATG